ncbi:MAG: sigma-70 family RNA polymerase sigma factor [Pseudomonadota bacterium]|nr:sigma-70 family RNA polymerase sigma factor [Pseudomonadota bacterium]
MTTSKFAQEIEQHRSYLLRVAHLQLRDKDVAEDVVQDTLLAALSGSGFSGKSTLRTWLTGILKHKIVDAIRRKQRDAVPLAVLAAGGDEMDAGDVDTLFREDGTWQAAPGAWGHPEQALERREFFDMLEFCLEKLPAATGRVFMMREVLELETDEICKELAITSNNLWVILYRARVALRMCLEQNWFANPGQKRNA